MPQSCETPSNATNELLSYLFCQFIFSLLIINPLLINYTWGHFELTHRLTVLREKEGRLHRLSNSGRMQAPACNVSACSSLDAFKSKLPCSSVRNDWPNQERIL